jgi:hypothetical protein
MKKEPYHQPLLTRHSLPRVVAAKAVGECAFLLVCSGGAAGVQLTVSKVGTNLVISWPASATNCVLESSSCLATGWTAVAASPVTNNQSVSVSVPLAGPQQFFRLKTSEKDPSADKPPTEKDPATDKNKEKETDKDPLEKDPSTDKHTEKGLT